MREAAAGVGLAGRDASVVEGIGKAEAAAGQDAEVDDRAAIEQQGVELGSDIAEAGALSAPVDRLPEGVATAGRGHLQDPAAGKQGRKGRRIEARVREGADDADPLAAI